MHSELNSTQLCKFINLIIWIQQKKTSMRHHEDALLLTELMPAWTRAASTAPYNGHPHSANINKGAKNRSYEQAFIDLPTLCVCVCVLGRKGWFVVGNNNNNYLINYFYSIQLFCARINVVCCCRLLYSETTADETVGRVTTVEKKLYISNLHNKHAGRYTCAVLDDDQRIQETMFDLLLYSESLMHIHRVLSSMSLSE